MNQPNPLATKPSVVVEDDDRHVSMSNRLARSAHGLNLAEKRLVALGLAQSDSSSAVRHLKANANTGWLMRVRAMEYAEAFDIDVTTAYEQLQAAADKLFDRYVRYEVPGRRGKPEEKKFRWVSSCRYAPGEGYVELNFSPEIAPHLAGLSKELTSYRLRQAAAFHTVYAWRLFELIKSWESVGAFTMKIEEFWEAMEAPPSCQKDFKALRIRVIEPSVEAIKAKCAMLVEWTPVRAGSRRVIGLEFRFSPDPQGRLDMDAAAATAQVEAGQTHGANPA